MPPFVAVALSVALAAATAVASAAGTAAGTPSTPPSDWEQVKTVLTLLLGGVSGATVSALVTWRKQRLDVALSVVKDHFEGYNDLAHAKWLLMQDDIHSLLADRTTLRTFFKAASRLQYVAHLLKSGTANKSLLTQASICQEIEDFSKALALAKDKTTHLTQAWEMWPELQSFKA